MILSTDAIYTIQALIVLVGLSGVVYHTQELEPPGSAMEKRNYCSSRLLHIPWYHSNKQGKPTKYNLGLKMWKFRSNTKRVE